MNPKGGKFLRTGPREIIDKLKCDGKTKGKFLLVCFICSGRLRLKARGREGTNKMLFLCGNEDAGGFCLIVMRRMRLVAIRAVFRSIIIKVTLSSAQDVPEPQNF